MRSSVTGDHKGNKAALPPSQPPSPSQSYPSLGYQVRGSKYASPHQWPVDARSQAWAGTRPPTPLNPSPAPTEHRFQQPQSGLILAPSEGWLAMVLLAIAVYSVVFSI